MLPQLSLFQQCSIQSQDVMQTWLHWRRKDALLVQKHFVALFHPKPNECLRFDLESCNLMCTYTVTMSHSTARSGSLHDALHLHYWGEPERAPH